MNTIIIGIHVSACVLLVALVLLQAGKGSGMGSSLGGSSQALFDTKSTTGILGKATTIVAIIFMLTSLTMGYKSSRGSGSIINNTNLIVESPDCCLKNNEADCTASEHVEDPTYILDAKVN